MLYTIYRVTHLESGKCYIGKHQTRDPNDGYMGSGQLIRRAVKKHGLSAFKKEVLHVFETESEMNAKEAEMVTEEFCARDDTYNVCPGGQGGWGYVNRTILSPAERYKRSSKGGKAAFEKFPDSFKKACIAGGKSTGAKNGSKNQASTLTESARLKRKATMKANRHMCGAKNSQFGTCWITDGVSSKKIQKSEIENHPGWERGRVIRG